MHFIHKSDDQLLGGKEISPGLFWGGDYERLIDLIQLGRVSENDYKFFVGYSGWGIDQLNTEIEQKSWFIYRDFSMEKLFNISSEQLWKSVLEELGGKFKMISKYPIDPRMN